MYRDGCYMQHWEKYDKYILAVALIELEIWRLTPLLTILQFYWWNKIAGPGENIGPVASHWQTLSHNVVHLVLNEIHTHNISGDKHWLHK